MEITAENVENSYSILSTSQDEDTRRKANLFLIEFQVREFPKEHFVTCIEIGPSLENSRRLIEKGKIGKSVCRGLGSLLEIERKPKYVQNRQRNY